MPYFGGIPGESPGVGGHYELLRAAHGEQGPGSAVVDSIVLPADMHDMDRLVIRTMIRQGSGSDEPDFAEAIARVAEQSLMGDTCVSANHYVENHLATSYANAGSQQGIVSSVDWRSGSGTPSWFTEYYQTLGSMADLAGLTVSLDFVGYIAGPGSDFTWGWAWSVHRIRAS